jgi:hypothetical protein
VYGKHFSSTYTGSMFGAGPTVFAVWGYVIANTREGTIELNPKLLASIIGTTEVNIKKAIQYLAKPDLHSRSKKENGRRLIREGEFMYRVPTYFDYRGLQDENQRREYLRVKKAESRARIKARVNQDGQHQSTKVNHSLQKSTQTETEAETIQCSGSTNSSNHPKSILEGGFCEKPNGKHPPSPPKKYTQSDHDEKNLRKIAEAEKEYTRKLQARVGTEPVTDQEFFTVIAEMTGLTVKKILELKAIQRKWPNEN